MPYRILEHESVEESVRRVSREQIHRAIDEIDSDLDLHETVHQVRKRCKKVRAVLRLVRHELGVSYSDENARFRDAARPLSQLRDSTALLETFDVLVEHSDNGHSFTPIRDALEAQRRDLIRNDIDPEARMLAFRAELEQAWADVGNWNVGAIGFDAIRSSLEKTYRRGRKALRVAFANPTDERFHELRKRAKYHWYHMRLLQESWKPVLKARRKQQKLVSDLLGDDHDLAVLHSTILTDPERFDAKETVDTFVRLLTRRRSELQSEARYVAERLYAETPGKLADRMETYWKTWREELRLVNVTTGPPLA